MPPKGKASKKAKPGTFGFDSAGRYYVIDATNVKKLSSKTYTLTPAGHLNLTDCTCPNADCLTIDPGKVTD